MDNLHLMHCAHVAGLQAQLRKREAEIHDLKAEVKRLKGAQPAAPSNVAAAAPASMQTGPLLNADKLAKQVTKVTKQIERGLKADLKYTPTLKNGRPGNMSVEVPNVTEQVAKEIMGAAWGPVRNSYVTGQVAFDVPAKPMMYRGELRPSATFTVRWLPFADLLSVAGSFSISR